MSGIDALSVAINDVADTDAEYTITRGGQPAAVLLSHDRYEGLLETLDILSDPDTMNAIAEATSE